MAIPLTDTFGFTPNKPNIDKRYLASNGQPYASVAAAETALASRLVETCVGLTVLVKESGWAKAKEYWVQPKGTTPETYGLVEKGAGTTDYADLDNKPTINNVPLSDNKTASDLRLATAEQGGKADTAIQGVSVNGTEVTPDPTTKKVALTIENGKSAYQLYLDDYEDEHGSTDGALDKADWLESLQGKSALQIYNETMNTSLDEAGFINVLKQNYPMEYVVYNQAAAGQSIGTAFAAIDQLAASDSTAGKLYLMPNDGNTPTGTELFITVQTGATTYMWYRLGALSVPSNVLTEDKIVQNLNTGGVDKVPSAAAVKGLKEQLYGEVDESVQQEVALPSTPIGGAFRNTTETDNVAFYYNGISRCAYVDLTDYINAGYKKLRIVMPAQGGTTPKNGGLTFVKRMDAPTATSTYAELVSGGYLSSVHDAGDNVLFRCSASTTEEVVTEYDIPTDAVGVCFRYKAYTDGTASDTVRKPSALYVYGVHKAGDIGDVEKKVDGVMLSEEDSAVVVNLGMYISMGKPKAPAVNPQNYGYSVIDVSGADRVRFTGVLYGAAKNRVAGYAFYTNENNGSQTDGTGMIAPYVTYPSGTQTDTEVKDYTVAVPTNAKWLFVTSKLQLMPDFKCVLIHDADTMEEKFEQVDERLHKIENSKLKILVLGNSYAMDSFMYVPFILKNYGVNIELGIYRKGGGTLAQCVEDWDTPASDHTFDFIDTAVDGAWRTREDNMSPKLCVDRNDWDIVVIQQQSEASLDYTTYIPYVRQLVNLIQTELGRGVLIAWNININRIPSNFDEITAGMTEEEKQAYKDRLLAEDPPQILTNISKIVKREGVGMLFPYGTAVFNARTNSTLDALGHTGHLWYDNTHLQDGLPRYLAACASVQAIFNRFYPKLSVMGDVTAVTESIILNVWKLPSTVGAGTTYGIVDITTENRYLAQICAVIANNYPLEICDIES